MSCCSWTNPGESARPWYEESRAPDRYSETQTSPSRSRSWRRLTSKPGKTQHNTFHQNKLFILPLSVHVLNVLLTWILNLTRSATFARSIIVFMSLLHSMKVRRRFFPTYEQYMFIKNKHYYCDMMIEIIYYWPVVYPDASSLEVCAANWQRKMIKFLLYKDSTLVDPVFSLGNQLLMVILIKHFWTHLKS